MVAVSAAVVLIASVSCAAVAQPPRVELDLSAVSAGVFPYRQAYAQHGFSELAIPAAPGADKDFLAKRCQVGDTNATCALPHAVAYDHHQGLVDVKESVRMWTASPPHAAPQFGVDQPMPHGLDFSRRGEQLIYFDATDDSGNAAEQLQFAILVMDYEPPAIVTAAAGSATRLELESCDPTQAHMDPNNRRYFIVPANEAHDAYDGDVSDTVTFSMTLPTGASYSSILRPDGEYHQVIDTHQLTEPGHEYKLHYTAHDYAAIFGRDNDNNQVSHTLTIAVVKRKPPAVYCKPQGFDAIMGFMAPETRLPAVAPVAGLSMAQCSERCFRQQYTQAMGLPIDDVRVCAFFQVRRGVCTLHSGSVATAQFAQAQFAALASGKVRFFDADLPAGEESTRIGANRQCQTEHKHECAAPYADPGAVCLDLRDSISGNALSETKLRVDTAGSIDVHTPGAYAFAYSCADAAGHARRVVRKLQVVDTTRPVVHIAGARELQIFAGDLGDVLDSLTVAQGALKATCTDTCAASLEPVPTLHEGGCSGAHACISPTTGHTVVCDAPTRPEVSADFIGGKAGTYGVMYSCADAAGNKALPQCRTLHQMGQRPPTSAPTPAVPTPAPTPTTVDCVLTLWGDWGACTETCGSGVQQRWRSVVTLPDHGGRPCPATTQLRNCVGVPPCPVHCEHTWGEWTPCSRTCGGGTRVRPLVTTVYPLWGGRRCPVGMEHVCNTGACAVDCTVGAWHAWSTCTKTCGGGARSRSRDVRYAAAHGGKPCPALGETVACATGACPPKCTGTECDCQMAQWGSWGSCTTTCGIGHRQRDRVVHRPALTGQPCCAFGAPCGALTDLSSCEPKACPVDCKVGAWSAWTPCSLSCGAGSTTRFRDVAVPAKFGGACPVGDLKEARGCQLAECPVPCVVGAWGAWSACTKTCGGGSQARTRTVSQHAAHGGQACPVLVASQFCVSQPCPSDCVVGNFSPWDACSASCDPGTTHRRRPLISPASAGGKGCGALTESKPCSLRACPVVCTVTAYGHWGACLGSGGMAVACGGGTQKRSRSIVHAGSTPCPTLVDSRPCATGPCAADCKVSAWGTWGACDLTCGGGLRVRVRTILSHAVLTGKSCGPLTNSGICNSYACPVDCVQSPWRPWSLCSVTCGENGMHVRTRSIAVATAHGGAACGGPAVQMHACSMGACPKHCSVGLWEQWSTCTRSCGGGAQHRGRHVTAHSEHGGAACPFTREERRCETAICPSDCVLSVWSNWAACSATCGGGVHARRRNLLHAPIAGGKGCNHKFEQKTCNSAVCPLDCVASAWGPWGRCSHTCGGGTRTRSRFVEQAAQHGGKTCTSLVETGACDPLACPVDCVVAYKQWSPCPRTCGVAYQTRAAYIASPEAHGGTACNMQPGVRTCVGLLPCPVDCHTSQWGAWTTCTRSCAGGTRQRVRQAARAPAFGGIACGTLTSTVACNAHACPVNCQQGPYGPWSQCTHTCGAGTQHSSRSVTTAPAHGGHACYTPSRQRTCTVIECPVHCAVSEFDEWSACSKTCGGLGSRTRFRAVVTAPKWGGRRCPALTGTEICMTPACPIDCAVTAWSGWSACAGNCGTGTSTRTRSIARAAAYTGAPCPALSQTSPGCVLAPCPVDCEMSSWSSWDSCTVTCRHGGHGGQGGQRRQRAVLVAAAGAGKSCGPTDDVRPCLGLPACDLNPKCPDEWTAWDECSHSCSGGLQRRHAVISLAGCPQVMQRTCNMQGCPTLAPSPAPTPAPSPAPTPLEQVMPIIRIVGADVLDVEASRTEKYEDLGAHCISPIDGRVGGLVVRGVESVDRSKLGAHVITYDCCSRGACARRATRIVRIVDSSCPYCRMLPGPSTVEAHFKYHDPGAVCTDGRDGSCPMTKLADVATTKGCVTTATSDISVEHLGTYHITYRARDALGNWNDGKCLGSRTYVREVRVVDTLKPVIALHYKGQLLSVGGGGVGTNGELNPAERVMMSPIGQRRARGDMSPVGVENARVLMAEGAISRTRSSAASLLLGAAAAAAGVALLAHAMGGKSRRRRGFVGVEV